MHTFILWALGFWPSLALAEYLFRLSDPARPVLTTSDHLSAAASIWLGVMLYLYVNQPDSSDGASHHDDEGDRRNVLVIVEAPNARLNREIGPYIESLAFFDPLPVKGKRIVLNAEDDNDSNVLGTVEEVAETVHATDDGTIFRMWVKLDNADDYQVLSGRMGWDTGVDNNRRSTTLAAGRI